MRDYGTTNNTPAHQVPPVWRAPEGLEDLTAAQVGDGGACQHTNDKPDRSGAPRGLRGLAGHHTDTPTDWRPPRGLRGLAAVPVGGGRAWPGFEKTRRANHQHTRLHWCGGHRRELPRCRWAAAGPGRASRRRAERSSRRGRRAGGPLPTGTHSGPAQQNWPRGGRAWPGFEIDHSERSSRVAISRAGRRPPAPTRRHKHSATNT